MLSGPVLKQFRTYLKSQVGNGWSVEGRKSKGRLLKRVSFRYLSSERNVVWKLELTEDYEKFYDLEMYPNKKQFGFKESGRQDSNLRPSAPKAILLTFEKYIRLQ